MQRIHPLNLLANINVVSLPRAGNYVGVYEQGKSVSNN